MGNKPSLALQDEEIKLISDGTGFSATQIEKLYSRFTHLDRSHCGSLSKNDFMSIPELVTNPLCARLTQAFYSGQEGGRIDFRQFVQVLAAFRPSTATGNHPTPIDKSFDSDTSKRLASFPINKKLKHDGNIERSTVSIKSRHMQTIDISRQKHDNLMRESKFNMDDSREVNLMNKLWFIYGIYDADNDGRISFKDLRSILKMMVGEHIGDIQLDKIATRAFVEVDQDSDGFIEFGEFCQVFAGKCLDDKLRVRFFS